MREALVGKTGHSLQKKPGETSRTTRKRERVTPNCGDVTPNYKDRMRNDDQRAAIMSSVMAEQQHHGVRAMWSALADRAGVLASISRLENHVPNCVLARLRKETKLRGDLERTAVSIPLSKSVRSFINEIDASSPGDLSYSDLSEEESDLISISSSSSMSSDTSEEDIGLDIDGDVHPETANIDMLPSKRKQHDCDLPTKRSHIACIEQQQLNQQGLGVCRQWKSFSDFMDINKEPNLTTSSILSQGKQNRSNDLPDCLQEQTHRGSVPSPTEEGHRHGLRRAGSTTLISLTRGPLVKMDRRGSFMGQNGQNIHSSGKTPKDSSGVRRHRSATSSQVRLSSKCDLPVASRRSSALLFIDISGFTKLSTLFDPEGLSKAINSYFARIVDLVTAHGGDVLKFAGDALFAEWKSSPANGPVSAEKMLQYCVCAAATCAAQVVATCSDFPVTGGDRMKGRKSATLNVHCGLGVGEMIGVHLGDRHQTHREFVCLGDPIGQVAQAEGAAGHGEVVSSPAALHLLSQVCDLDHSLRVRTFAQPMIIAQRDITKFKVPEDAESTLAELCRDGWACRNTSIDAEGWSNKTLEKYKTLLSRYAHPIVRSNESSALKNPTITTSLQERNLEEAELRSIYTMFISPQINAKVTGSTEADRELLLLLNDVLKVTNRELGRFGGHLLQLIVDDKGVVLVATFGLRGSTFPNMVGERALPCTIVIHRALQSELGVKNRIGATVGTAYCGVAGGMLRHEYTVLGPSVNLAARLMASPNNPGILVNDTVRTLASSSFGFNALPPMVAKGFVDLVPIFEPLSPLERDWGRKIPTFVGRRTEITNVSCTAKTMSNSTCPSKMFLISGESGMGKTTFVVHAIDQIRNVMDACRRHVIVTKYVSKESDFMVPFSMYRHILMDVLDCFEGWTDEGSVLSEATGTSSSSASSSSSPMVSCQHPCSTQTLLSICKELCAPLEFIKMIGESVLNVDFDSPSLDDAPRETLSSKAQVSLMANLFDRCTENADLVVIAVDDIHQTDEMSWKVLQQLYETCPNILILCNTRPLTTYQLQVDPKFWTDLNGKYKDEDRFRLMELAGLDKDEIHTLVAKSLELAEGEVDHELVSGILAQSSGLPQYASELVDMVKRDRSPWASKGMSRRRGSTTNLGRRVYGSLDQLILHRIDSFDAKVRNILNLSAVLGKCFKFVEVLEVVRELSTRQREDDGTVEDLLLVNHIKEALNVAVKEGVLRLVYDGGDRDDWSAISTLSPSSQQHHKGENLSFCFCHDSWRSAILQLMLGERKRDLHGVVARILDSRDGRTSGNDFSSKMRLIYHWKANGSFSKVADLSLSFGKDFERVGLCNHTIRLYKSALEMWTQRETNDIEGQSIEDGMEFFTAIDAKLSIELYISMGKAFATMHNGSESVKAYKDALKILQNCKAAEQIEDRSISFPIFSGLYVALKMGKLEQDEDCSFEKKLNARFILETQRVGDPAHYSRALAMEAETYGRLGDLSRAFAAKAEIDRVYNPVKHSAEISKSYGSDRTAQLISVSCSWHWYRGDTEKATEVCEYVLNELMPLMETRNIHNSFIMVTPIIWVYKSSGKPGEALQLFERFVLGPFKEHFGEGAFTFFMPVYKPIAYLLDLDANRDVPSVERFEKYLEWALIDENLRLPSVMNSCSYLGRYPNSITAEICLLLAQRLHHRDERFERLVKNGLQLALEVVELATTNKTKIALVPAQMILRELEKLHEMI